MMLEDHRSPLRIPCQHADAASRWVALVNSPDDWAAFKTMCLALRKAYFGTFTARLLCWLVYRLVYGHSGRYISCSDYLADTTGVISRAQMAIMQRQYTWAHVAYNFIPGCTTSCVRSSEGWRMMRSLDWGNVPVMAPAVRAYDLVDAQGKVTHTAGVQGMVGVLTFARPGLCGAINFAPKQRSFAPARFQSDPLFVLRDLVEDTRIDTLEAAIAFISRQRVSSPVFISLASDTSDNAAVVEIAHDGRQNVRYAQDGLLVQTNHFDPAGPFASENSPPYETEPPEGWEHSNLLRNSRRRRDDLMTALQPLVGASAAAVEAGCLEAYTVAPVWNHETIYWTFADPAAGSLRLWGRQVEA
ncbi:hypothetical protein Q9Q94_09475 [Uliginosibacterium sp. 31-16]|uniref:hypothetical protein n=1 Tax=Uliginosibacterium sp. 31-16 TaxID=3068315 RepID=UPI00273D3767|nr:hypothetical protein [Uliginosibacterium sp. 31-16]MDP5239761.1 hypothetical protein [Uliginosibacterium sp. 31-16]